MQNDAHPQKCALLSTSFIDVYDEEYIRSIIVPPNTVLNNTHAVVGTDVMTDVEMFTPYKDVSITSNRPNTETHVSDTVYNSMFHLENLKGSQIYTKYLLNTPLRSHERLIQRQHILKHLEPDIHAIDELFKVISPLEDDVLWFFQDHEDNVRALYDIAFFQFNVLKRLNNNGPVLTFNNIYRILLSPIIGILSPLLYFVMPYLIIVYRFKFKLSFKQYLTVLWESCKLMFEMRGWSGRLRYCSFAFTLFFYFQGVLNQIDASKTLYAVSSFILERMNNILTFLKVSDTLLTTWSCGIFIEHVFFGVDAKSLRNEPTNIPHNIDPKKVWLMSNFGQTLKMYKVLKRTNIKSTLSRVYMLGSLVSILKAKTSLCLEYPTFCHCKSPVCHTRELWHPCLKSPTNPVVKNDAFLGGNSRRNMIITGPNAGGKSTMAKSILINVLLCQSLSLTCSNECTLTPFTYINSQINIPDCKGKESLFQAEMHRCKLNLDVLKTLDSIPLKHRHSIIVMDEIFNSTNPLEGISGAYAIASKLGANDRLILVFTTHFVYLTQLGLHPPFDNFKMDVVLCKYGYKFPYRVTKGVSDQTIALELLELNGFDKDVINVAKGIRDKLRLRKTDK